VYQHDIDLAGRFARKNPNVIAQVREKLLVLIVMYRYENLHIFFPGKRWGRTSSAGYGKR
jgi:hypothetical protein